MKIAEHTQRSREIHHASLEPLQAKPRYSGLKLWRKLRRIESLANAGAVAYCNGEKFHHYDFGKDGSTAWESFSQTITACVKDVFGKLPDGFFVNGDPRGYALKLDNEKVTIPDGMHKDWGGYGILAPEIN